MAGLAFFSPVFCSFSHFSILFSIDSSYNPVKEAGAGLTVPPEDSEALSQAIIKLFDMPMKERIKMGEKGATYAKAFHDMEKLADQFHRLLSHLNMQ